MKSSVIIIFLILLLTSCGSKKYTVNDQLIRTHTEEYIAALKENKIKKRGTRGLYKVMFVDGLLIHYLIGSAAYGLTTQHKNRKNRYIILLNKEMYEKYGDNFLNAVIYHEMFHVWSKMEMEHCDESKGCPEVLYSKISGYKLALVWNDRSKEQYFNYLKYIQELK